MFEEEGTIRSEKPSLDSLSLTLSAIKVTRDTDELATLLFIVTELYSDSSCRCEEKAVSYGEGSEEAKACQMSVGKGRAEIVEMYKDIIKTLKGE